MNRDFQMPAATAASGGAAGPSATARLSGLAGTVFAPTAAVVTAPTTAAAEAVTDLSRAAPSRSHGAASSPSVSAPGTAAAGAAADTIQPTPSEPPGAAEVPSLPAPGPAVAVLAAAAVTDSRRPIGGPSASSSGPAVPRSRGVAGGPSASAPGGLSGSVLPVKRRRASFSRPAVTVIPTPAPVPVLSSATGQPSGGSSESQVTLVGYQQRAGASKRKVDSFWLTCFWCSVLVIDPPSRFANGQTLAAK